MKTDRRRVSLAPKVVVVDLVDVALHIGEDLILRVGIFPRGDESVDRFGDRRSVAVKFRRIELLRIDKLQNDLFRSRRRFVDDVILTENVVFDRQSVGVVRDLADVFRGERDEGIRSVRARNLRNDVEGRLAELHVRVEDFRVITRGVFRADVKSDGRTVLRVENDVAGSSPEVDRSNVVNIQNAIFS